MRQPVPGIRIFKFRRLSFVSPIRSSFYQSKDIRQFPERHTGHSEWGYFDIKIYNLFDYPTRPASFHTVPPPPICFECKTAKAVNPLRPSTRLPPARKRHSSEAGMPIDDRRLTGSSSGEFRLCTSYDRRRALRRTISDRSSDRRTALR